MRAIFLLLAVCFFVELVGEEAKKIAVLVCRKFASVPTHVDNKELIAPFTQHGLTYEEVIWDAPDIDFSQYEAALVRATWDYIEKREEFLQLLNTIASQGIPLFNSLETLAWNSKKTYLLDLEERGIQIIPTRIVTRKTVPNLEPVLQELSAENYVIKPAVSGGAHRTFRTDARSIQELYETQYAADEEVLIQPFLDEVRSEGEWSLVFFNGIFSHAVLSRPAHGDFRVQRMHGGTVTKVTPALEMLIQARRVLESIPGGIPLYARVDFIRHKTLFLLMELEAIEPGLFMLFDSPSASMRFTSALCDRLKEK